VQLLPCEVSWNPLLQMHLNIPGRFSHRPCVQRPLNDVHSSISKTTQAIYEICDKQTENFIHSFWFSHSCTYSLTHSHFHSSIYLFIRSFIHTPLIDWLTDWLIDWLIDWSIHSLIRLFFIFVFNVLFILDFGK